MGYIIADVYKDMEQALSAAGTPRGDVADSVKSLRSAVKDIRGEGGLIRVDGVTLTEIGHVWAIEVTYPCGSRHIMDLTIRTDGRKFNDEE